MRRALAYVSLRVLPPSIGIAAPVTYVFRGDRRNAARSPTSGGFPGLPTGMSAQNSAMNCSGVMPRVADRSCARSRIRSVRKMPGQMLFTSTPCGATSRASALANPSAAGREAFEFERTASRLVEMRSRAYLALPHGAVDSFGSGEASGLVET